MSDRSVIREFIGIAAECRKIMVENTMNSDSEELYDALLSDPKSEIFRIRLELYEVEWIETFWEKGCEVIENLSCPLPEKKEIVSLFAKWYSDFVDKWGYKGTDMALFGKWDIKECDNAFLKEQASILRSLISVNNEWEKNLKRMKVSFRQQKKILYARVKELEMTEEC